MRRRRGLVTIVPSSSSSVEALSRANHDLAVGDFRFVHDEHGRWELSQLAFVAGTRPATKSAPAHVLVALVTNVTSAGTDYDVLISGEESGLPSPIWVQMDVFGWVRREQLDDRLWGRVWDTALLASILASFVNPKALRMLEREGRTGPPLVASDDARWLMKRASYRALALLGAGERRDTYEDAHEDDIAMAAAQFELNDLLSHLDSQQAEEFKAAFEGLDEGVSALNRRKIAALEPSEDS